MGSSRKVMKVALAVADIVTGPGNLEGKVKEKQ
jgi:hypothetical protein